MIWAEDRVREAIQDIGQTATVLRPRPTLHILKDEPDNRILECAIATQAEYVVSGDRHLLALKHHADITMISLAGFLTKLHKWNLQPRVNTLGFRFAMASSR